LVISKIKLANFRNLTSFLVYPSAKLNLLQGGNGSGKTAVLEAICFMARGRSFRPGVSGALINLESKSMAVHLDVEDSNGTTLCFSGISQKGEPSLFQVDGLNRSRGSDISRALPVQIITPDESDLVFSGPSVRRSFLDWGLFHVEHEYLELARKYKKTLKQRNAWIKAGARVSDPWLHELSALAAKINEQRESYLARICDLLRAELGAFGGFGKIGLEYYGGGVGLDPNEALEKFQSQIPYDQKAGTTSLGPHRGDIKIVFNGIAAKDYLSRGQAKLVSVLFALSQTMLLLNERSRKSILLIDDISAELDEDNLVQCMEMISEMQMQTFMTSSNAFLSAIFEKSFEESKTFHVKHGQLI